MKKVYYKILDGEKNLSSREENIFPWYLEELKPSSSEWFNSLDFFVDKAKNAKDFFSTLKHNFINGNCGQISPEELVDQVPTTVKNCPGIKELFKRCYVLRSPCDFHLTIAKESYFFNCSEKSLMNVDSHSQGQFISERSTLFKDKINIKFIFPFIIKSTTPFMFLPPNYHLTLPWDVLLGTIDGGRTVPLNLNTLFSQKEEDYFVKKGTPLSYLYFHDKVKFYKKDNIALPLKQKFVGS